MKYIKSIKNKQEMLKYINNNNLLSSKQIERLIRNKNDKVKNGGKNEIIIDQIAQSQIKDEANILLNMNYNKLIYNYNESKYLTAFQLRKMILNGTEKDAWYLVTVFFRKIKWDTYNQEFLNGMTNDEGKIKENTLLKAFRGSGKSEMIISLALTYILRSQEESIAVISSSMHHARKITGSIRTTLENDDIDNVFPEIQKNQTEWSNTLNFKRYNIQNKEPTLQPFGIESNGLVGGRFSRMIFDDIVNEQKITPNQRQKLIDIYDQNIAPATSETGTTIHFIGTHYHWDDLYVTLARRKDIFNKPLYHDIVIPAIRVDDEGIERFTRNISREKALSILNAQKINPVAYKQQYQQIVKMGQGATFNKEWMQYYEKIEIENNKYYITFIKDNITYKEQVFLFMGVDLAISDSEKADNTVISVTGITSNYNIFIIDLFLGKWTFNETLNNIKNVYKKYLKIEQVVIESVAYQKSVPSTLKNDPESIQLNMNIIERNTKINKEIRMNSFSGYWENKQVFINPKLPFYNIFEQEYLSFPDGKHDDTIDSIYLSIEPYLEDLYNREVMIYDIDYIIE